ncbi:MAG: hypothetical protein WAN65_11240 [Candidatus Sulfotelmatobacter sp.]
MTPDERELMAILCERIAKEQDPNKFTYLIQELNTLLEANERRLTHRIDNSWRNTGTGNIRGRNERTSSMD